MLENPNEDLLDVRHNFGVLFFQRLPSFVEVEEKTAPMVRRVCDAASNALHRGFAEEQNG